MSIYKNYDKTFADLFKETQGRINGLFSDIAVGPDKGEILYHLAHYAKMIRGDVAEVGVYQGGSARILAKVFDDRPVRLFDTFEGIPYVNEDDTGFKVNDFGHVENLLDQVRKTLSDCKTAEFFPGIFPQSAEGIAEPRPKYAFVHADADVYQSTKDICEYFYPCLSVGAVLIFDDYGYAGAQGCRNAVDEFFKTKFETPSILSTGQALIIKSYQAAKSE